MKKQLNLFVLLCFYFTCQAQKKITLEDAVGRTFLPQSSQGFNWMKDSRFYTTLANNAIIRKDTKNKAFSDTLFFDARINLQDYELSHSENYILLITQINPIYRHSYKAVYYLFDTNTKSLKPISPHSLSCATFSPDDKKIAYTRENNLYVYEIENQKETQLTFDGKFNSIINGSTDWVNEEEFGYTKAFWWSPDSKKIAYQTFDETHVKEYNMQIWGKNLYPQDYRFKYPKAGEANAVIYLTVHSLETGVKQIIDLGADSTVYLPRVQWTNHPDILSIRKLNRLQNQLELLHYNFATKKLELIYSEKSESYIDLEACEELFYSRNGDFLLLTSESDGHKHIYQYSTSGKLLNQLTKGPYDVIDVLGFDQSGKAPVLYYTSNEENLLGKDFFSLNLKTGKKEKLSKRYGTNSVKLSRDFKFYELTHSSFIHPPTSYLFEIQKNSLIDTLVSNHTLKDKCLEYGFGLKEAFSFHTRQGQKLYGYMIKPLDFDSTRKYPLLIHTYGGPGRQMVSDSWAGSHFVWHQMLAQQGYLVAVVDNRGVPGYGAEFKKATYGALGDLDAQDQIAAAQYFAGLGFVDTSRIGIWGWSYGGYMSAVCAMKAPDLFKLAISVAPVTSWRFYDTIYTERFLGLPQDNPRGYDDFSPIGLAKNLKSKFLLVHGTADDNVHFQNAVALQAELIKAGIQFDSFFYPDRNHGIYGGNTRLHLYGMMTSFIVSNL